MDFGHQEHLALPKKKNYPSFVSDRGTMINEQSIAHYIDSKLSLNYGTLFYPGKSTFSPVMITVTMRESPCKNCGGKWFKLESTGTHECIRCGIQKQDNTALS